MSRPSDADEHPAGDRESGDGPPTEVTGDPAVAGDRLEAAEPAEPERRVVARIVDTLIVGVPVTTAGTALAPGPAGTLAGPVLVAFAVAYFCYELPQLVLWGQTLGKRFTRIRVVDAGGPGRVPITRLLLRTGVYAGPLALRPIPVLGLLAAAFWLVNGGWVFRDPARRALHDQLAGTTVIRTG
jgi:uncharacterized RDD family membrane protein YckC